MRICRTYVLQRGADGAGGSDRACAEDPVLDGADGRPVSGQQRSDDAARVGRLLEVLAAVDRGHAEVVALLGELDGSGIIEREEGMESDELLATAGALTGPDRQVLRAAVAVLRDLPTVAAAFQRGTISWGQVRAIVRACRRRSKADRAVIDARVGATLAELQRSDDADQLVWAVEACAEQLREERERNRSERRSPERSFVSVQPALDGGARVYGELAALDAGPVLAALDAAAPPPSGARGAGAGADEPDGGRPGWTESPRSRDYASALAGICTDRLTRGAGEGDTETGTDGAEPASRSPGLGRRAPRSAITCQIDLGKAAAQPDGTLHLGLRGDLPRITAAALEALAADGAMIRVLLTDGQRPLAMSKARRIPRAVREAVSARDQGCRAPACSAPAVWTDLHHFRVPQAVGRDHEPDGLSSFCRRHHRMIERHGWELSLHAPSGQLTFRRGDRTWTTLPNGTPLAPAPAAPGPDPPAGAPF